MSTAIAINGACGRMGLTVGRLAVGEFRVAAALEVPGHPAFGKPYPPASDVMVGTEISGDVLVDFSTPEGAISKLKECREKGMAAVICTTGLTDESEIDRAAEKIAVVYASNMSVGVNTLFRFVPEIEKALGPEFDVDIIETHHRGKKDAPSGTAKTLAERLSGKPTMHSLRSGDEVGEHRVVFGGPGERIEVVHRATTREVFARGALRAAEFSARAKPGRYTMLDVLADR